MELGGDGEPQRALKVTGCGTLDVQAASLLSHPKNRSMQFGEAMPGPWGELCPVSPQPRRKVSTVRAPGEWQHLLPFPPWLFWDASPAASCALCTGL